MRNNIRDYGLTAATPTTRPTSIRVTKRRTFAPLHWWRTLPPASFTETHLETLTSTLARLAIVREPQWPAAVGGDGAAAVGIALRASKGDFLTPTVEIAMTALLPPAILGDPAAALVLAAIIDRMIGGTRGSQLANSWLAYADLLPKEGCRLGKLTSNASCQAD